MAIAAENPNRYSIDASSLIEAWMSYAPDFAPGVWERLEGLVASGILISSDEVLLELKRKHDQLYQWAKKHQGIFHPPDEAIQQSVLQILRQHPKLLNMRKNRSGADPFVIAVALVAKCAVVSEEGYSGNPKDTPHIPDVCRVFRVRHMSLVDLMREQKFVLR